MKFFIIYLAILAIQSVNANTRTQKLKHFNEWITYIKQNGNNNKSLLHQSKSKAFLLINHLQKKQFIPSCLPVLIIDQKFLTKLKHTNKDAPLNNQYYSIATIYSGQQDQAILDLSIKRREEHFIIKNYQKQNQEGQDYFSFANCRQDPINL